MQFGKKNSSSGYTFGKKVANYAAKFGKKFGDIAETVGGLALPLGRSVGYANPMLGAEIVSLANLAKGASRIGYGVSNALEKRRK